MRVLITGGAGFIGRRLAKTRRLQGDEVVILDSLEPQVHSDPAAVKEYLTSIGAELQVGYVCERAAVTAALEGVDAVVHLAAQTGVGQSMYRVAEYIDHNITGTGVLLDAISAAAAKPKRILVASSRAVYGEGARSCPGCGLVRPQPRRVEDLELGRWEPRCPECGKETALAETTEDFHSNSSSVYALSKAAQEELIAIVAPTLGIEWTSLRLSNVYGAGQPLHNPYTGVLAAFANAAKRNDTVKIYEGGDLCRDLVHVDDVVTAFSTALTSDATNVILNIGSGEQSRLDAVAKAIIDALGSSSKVEHTDAFRVGDIRAFAPALGRAAEVIGYRPQVTVGDGVAEFARWAAEQDAAETTAASDELLERGLLRGGLGA